MLTLPGAPSSSWAMYRQQLLNVLRGPQLRVAAAFFLFGLLNNVFSVMIVSAALDLVGPHIPKGTVLLATTLPGVTSKLFLPYVIHVVPYGTRMLAFSLLSTVGMLLVALTPSYSSGANVDFGLAVGVKIFGIVLASLSSGAGELSFLGLTHYYGNTGLAAWGSGTGAAGLVGAGVYALVTGPMGVSVRHTLLGSSFWPFGMAFAFFAILPAGPMKAAAAESQIRSSRSGSRRRGAALATEEEGRTGAVSTGLLPTEIGRLQEEEETNNGDDDDEDALARSDQALLRNGSNSRRGNDNNDDYQHHRFDSSSLLGAFSENLRRARSLFFPFMLPLFIVYVGEYTINQGVTPTLLFKLPSPERAPMFEHYREFYPAYATVYQLGVFVSRSSIFFPHLFRFHALYFPSFLQLANLVLLVAHAVWDFLPSVWWLFGIIFWEGLLGGGVYVNTFAEILERVPVADREFSLSATSVSDSTGILLASVLSMAIEVSLCGYQVRHGRDYCNKL